MLTTQANAEAWKKELSKSILTEKLDRILPNKEDEIKVVYKKKVQENPDRFREILFFIDTNISPYEVIEKHGEIEITKYDAHIEEASRMLTI